LKAPITVKLQYTCSVVWAQLWTAALYHSIQHFNEQIRQWNTFGPPDTWDQFGLSVLSSLPITLKTKMQPLCLARPTNHPILERHAGLPRRACIPSWYYCSWCRSCFMNEELYLEGNCVVSFSYAWHGLQYVVACDV
jgi:hypothetical protein